MSDNLTFDSILADCEVSMMDFLTDPAKASASFVKVHAFLVALAEDVQRTPEKAEGEKVDPPHVAAWKADLGAHADAVEIVSNIIERFEQYEDNAALMFHLRNEVREVLSKYLANEVDYQELLAEKASPDVKVARNTRAINRERFQVGKVGLTNLYNLIGHTLTLPTEVLSGEGKSIVPNLPKLQGNYGAGSAATGVNARLYQLTFTVDGEKFDDPRMAMRAVYTGADRVGKSTSDFLTAIETAIKCNVSTLTKPANCKINDRKIAIEKVAK